ncbi:NAD(P)/FAD-dependent oxidoreductase [Zavarzinia aquatilis]|uniref:FAD-dependent oxidoreductase n=1 Tax=Zavarzinia aquatilis TaxID=2211142 RepID=A0A317EGB0_9PROT|nr:FAD-binding oxidoreductase [Zavarzinia aquatilis]PWR25344.1 FAD-dependent oxidoreductase [Zavarzinia aquatilis]
MVSVSPAPPPGTVYAATCPPLPEQPVLREAVTADVCVIGGGFTGLAAALRLAQAGRDVVLLEAGRVGDGASGRNGGHASTGLRLKQEELERLYGLEVAHRLWDVALDAMTHFQGLIASGLDCDYTPGVYRLEHRPRAVEALSRHAEHMRRHYGFEALTPLGPADIRQRVASDAYCGGLHDAASGHVQPLKLALGLARRALEAGVRVFEATPALAVRDGVPAGIVTPGGKVTARQVIHAGNGMTSGLVSAIDRHVMPIRNYILATEPLPPPLAASLIAGGAAASDSRFVVYYFRVDRNRRLVFGGGETYSYRDPRNLADFVRRHMLRVFPQLGGVAVAHAWGGTLGITMSRMPYVRRIGEAGLAAGGFSGRGVVLAPYMGQVLAEAALGRSAVFDLFAGLPAQAFPGGPALRAPLLAAGMAYYRLRDRLGL